MPDSAPSGSNTSGGLLLLVLGALCTYLVARFLANYLSRVSPPPAAMAAPPADSAAAPVHVGELTLEELRQYDGSDASKPLLLVRARVCLPRGRAGRRTRALARLDV